MLSLFVFGLIVFAVAFAGSRFMPDAWHAALAKPEWNPPNWVFAPVWTVLYICIAVAGWLAWRAAGDAWSLALTFWVLQLFANGIWTWLFFGRHRIDLALVDIAATLGLIVAFIVAAHPLDATAAWLLVPYLVWVSFAAVLNFSIWQMNRHAPIIGRELRHETESVRRN